MKPLLIRLSILAVFFGLIGGGCGDGSNSPNSPDDNRNIRRIAQSNCGENVYTASLSTALAAWKDSIEAWPTFGDTLTTLPAFNEDVNVYLGNLVPVLQQWRTAINGKLGSAVLDSIAGYPIGATHRQNYLTSFSPAIASWEVDLEALRGTNFLATAPVFQPDVTAPEVVCVGDTTIACADSAGVEVVFESSAVDDCDPAPVVTCDPPSGSLFPVGETVVTCTAVDSLGNTAACSFTVRVEAAGAPEIENVVAEPSILWPPNHKWVDVHIAVEAESECDAEVECEIIDVESNEAVDGKGDGNTSPDWIITGDHTLKLRAERAGGGSGRVYTIRVLCGGEDGEERTVTVTVPHDQGGGKK